MATTTDTNGFYIIEGWVSLSELLLSGEDITAMPTQADQIKGRRWIRPADLADVVRPARFVDTPSGTRFAYGGLIFTWPMVNLSPMMVKYLQTTYFSPSGTPSNFYNRTWSNKLTVQTFNRASGVYEAYHVFGRFANFEGEAETALGGYNNLQIRYTAVAEAPEGPNLDPDISISVGASNLYVGVNFTFVLDSQNIGDADTWGTNQIDYTVPPEFDFVQVTSAASLTITYSVNSGVSYSGTAPGDLTTITNVRCIYNATIQQNLSSLDVNFEVTPNTAGAVTNIISFTTEGDTDDTNNAVTSNLTVNAFDPAAFDNLRQWVQADVSVYEDDAGTVVVTTAGDVVAHWADGSPVTTNDFLQSVNANRPTWHTTQINSLPIVRFDGLTQYLEGTTLSDIIGASAFTIFVVFEVNIASTTEVNAEDNDAIFGTTVSSQLGLHVKSDLSLYGTLFDGVSQKTISNTYVANTPTIVEMRLTANVLSLVKNNTARQTTAVATGVSDDTQTVELGRQYTGELYDGEIAEFIVYSVALTDTNSDLVREYLNDKYAVY